jgi:hypothetical protein
MFSHNFQFHQLNIHIPWSKGHSRSFLKGHDGHSVLIPYLWEKIPSFNCIINLLHIPNGQKVTQNNFFEKVKVIVHLPYLELRKSFFQQI